MNGATEAQKKAAEEKKRKKEGPFSIEEVLTAEAKEIHGDTPETQKLEPIGPEEAGQATIPERRPARSS